MRDRFELDDSRVAVGMTRAEARELIVAGRTADIYSRSVAVYEKFAARVDVVLVEGTDLTGHDFAVEFDLDARLANHPGCHVLAVVNGEGKSVAEPAGAVEVAREGFYGEKAWLLSVIVNRAAPEHLEELRAAVRPGLHHRTVYVVPEIKDIVRPTIGEICRALGARLIAGFPALLGSASVAASLLHPRR